jgi:predicted flap endonuclease-1-like 5' DNA nuclease
MTTNKLKSTVTEAVALDREIAEKSERLKELKSDLVTEAALRAEEHTETAGGGKSWTFAGADGCIARVSRPAPTLKDRISGIGKTIEKLQQAAGKAFPRLFQQIPAWSPVDNFRDAAIDILGPIAGRKLIRLCANESAPRVSFETKEIKDKIS